MWFFDSAIPANANEAAGSSGEAAIPDSLGVTAPADNALDSSGTGRIASGQHGIFDATSSNNTQGIVGSNKNIALSWSGIYPTGTSLETVPATTSSAGGDNNHTHSSSPIYSVGTGAHLQQALVVQ